MLIDTIRHDNITYRKDKTIENYQTKSSITNLILGDAQKLAIDAGNRDSISDDQTMQAIKKILKGVSDTIVELEKKQLDTSTAEIEKAILESYLPKQLSNDELKAIICEIIETHNIVDKKGVGVIMKNLGANYKGLYDGKLASNIISTIFP